MVLNFKELQQGSKDKKQKYWCITTNPESIILSHTLADAQGTWI